MVRFLMSLISLTLIILNVSCGDSCSFLNRTFSDPSCRSLKLQASKTVTLLSASCVPANARKVSASCPAASGSSGQCKAVSGGFPFTVILVPNNASGNTFTDASGKNYTNCFDLITDLNAFLISSASAVYISNNLTPGDTLTCTDAGGCVLPSSNTCFSAWDSVNRTANPTASAVLPIGANLLACAYIDNSALTAPVPAPASVVNWMAPNLMQPVTISGTVSFGAGAGWQNAY